jgi:nucleoside-diphosphate-sugar epimerase
LAHEHERQDRAGEADRCGDPQDAVEPVDERHAQRVRDRAAQRRRQRLQGLGRVSRYANLYGPGTAFSEGGAFVEQVRGRKLPVIGADTGVGSFVHVDDAAAATVAAIEQEARGIYNVADDDPAPAATWLPELARILGAKPPRHVPVWIARLAAGEAAVSMFTQIRGASNAKAKRELGWQPDHATWRDGFRRGLSTSSGADVAHERAVSSREA